MDLEKIIAARIDVALWSSKVEALELRLLALRKYNRARAANSADDLRSRLTCTRMNLERCTRLLAKLEGRTIRPDATGNFDRSVAQRAIAEGSRRHRAAIRFARAHALVNGVPNRGPFSLIF